MYYAQKVYYNNKPLILTNDKEQYISDHPVAAGYLTSTGAFPRNYRLAFEHLGKLTSLGALIEDLSQRSLQEELYALYEPIDAAGGVVQNEDGSVLMIYRRGKWDLPKGKCDDGEEISACALREVTEETGLQELALNDKICDTYHVYVQNGQNLLKRTTWYRMGGSKTASLVPQKEENILEVRWIAEKDLGPVLLKSYQAIREVLVAAQIKW
jgi:8-oxo-dGTP pyrophosphatase MutT (NUDIX family)